LIDLRSCQHDDGYYGRSITDSGPHGPDERTQVHSAQSSLVITHPSTNRAQRYLTSATGHQVSISRHCGPHTSRKQNERDLFYIVCHDEFDFDVI